MSHPTDIWQQGPYTEGYEGAMLAIAPTLIPLRKFSMLQIFAWEKFHLVERGKFGNGERGEEGLDDALFLTLCIKFSIT